jgi:acyl carrier protein
MSNREKIIEIFQDSFDTLYHSEYVDKEILVKENTNLISGDSILDSIGFVTLFAELEERLSEINGSEVYLVLEDIIDFEIDSPELTVGMMINYIEEVLNE